ncbi:MAG: hypothetical protein AAF942_09480 [Pseudomonadota bacterium]
MASCAVQSTIDVALWFLNRASKDDSYIQAQKLQRLLYVAQGCYAQENYGRKLMPATFLTHDLGPLEPNVYRVFEAGRPQIDYVPPAAEVEDFLERVWRRFGGHPVERLNALVLQQSAYRQALTGGMGEEIPHEQLVDSFKTAEQRQEKTLRTKDGRRVSKWVPGRSAPKGAR